MLALGQIGPEAKTAVPALTEVLKDEWVRRTATVALGEIGPRLNRPFSATIVTESGWRQRGIKDKLDEF